MPRKKYSVAPSGPLQPLVRPARCAPSTMSTTKAAASGRAAAADRSNPSTLKSKTGTDRSAIHAAVDSSTMTDSMTPRFQETERNVTPNLETFTIASTHHDIDALANTLL
jgi:hypothetical protein